MAYDYEATYIQVIHGKYAGCRGYIYNEHPRAVNHICKIWKNGAVNHICKIWKNRKLWAARLPKEYFEIIQPHPIFAKAM